MQRSKESEYFREWEEQEDTVSIIYYIYSFALIFKTNV